MPYDNIISRAKVAALQGVKGGQKMPIVTLKAGQAKKGGGKK